MRVLSHDLVKFNNFKMISCALIVIQIANTNNKLKVERMVFLLHI